MVAPTVFQNPTHCCTADFARRKERSVYYKFAKNLFKHAVSFDAVGAIINRPFDNVI